MGLLDSLRSGAGKINSLLYPGMLTGTDPQAAQAAASQAMMQMGAGLLSGANFGQAYGAGSVAGGNVLENLRREELLRQREQERLAQQEDRKRKMEAEQSAVQRQQYVQGLIAQGGNEREIGQRLLMAGEAELGNKYLDAAKKQIPDVESGVMWNPQTGQFEPVQAVIDAKKAIAAAGAPRSSTTIQMPKVQTAFDQQLGKDFAEQYSTLQKSAFNARSKIAQLEQLGSMVEGINTGRLAVPMSRIAAFADSFGITIDPTLGDKQAIESISNQFALQLRNPSGGAGMPGALSDKDREFLMASVPGLSKTPRGNTLIIEAMKRMAQRDVEVARMANDYVRRKGILDSGFYDELSAYSSKNEIFTDLRGASAGIGSAPPQAIEYLRAHPETAEAFRQKYGYLPDGI